MNILIVDDERSLRHVMRKYLSSFPGMDLFEADSKEEAFALLARQPIDIAFVDIRLSADASNRDGQIVIKHIHENIQAISVAVSSIVERDEIILAMRNGAYDYLFKETISREILAHRIEKLNQGVNNRELKQQVRALKDRGLQEMDTRFVGVSSAAERTRGLVRRFAFADRPVLVTGPTGTGKEVVARMLHLFSEHPDHPMISVNCGALPASLIESQLFGHRKGAFTGANEDREGHFQAVGEGTLFLDEIGELPLELQPKLLRVLENRTFMPIGSNSELEFKGRIVAATHADLEALVAERRFREDLLYRLNVLRIELPPLKERREDIPLFASLFLGKQGRKMSFTEEAVRVLSSFDWPGNVRQLRNAIDLLAILHDEPSVTAEMVRAVLVTGSDESRFERIGSTIRAFVESDYEGDKLAFLENVAIAGALDLAEGNKSAAAKMLGVHRKVVQRRVDDSVHDFDLDG